MLAEILSHFDLNAAPFEAPPDPGFLVVGAANEEAWATLRFIVRDGRNGCLLAAPAGCGKTIHARAAVDDPRDGSILWIDGRAPQDTCLRADVFTDGQRENAPLLERLGGRTRVVIVDNAVDVAPARWNELFYGLDRLAMAGDRCALIVLVDSDRSDDIRPGIHGQLGPRCLRRVELAALPPACIEDYVDVRLARAGGRIDRVFTDLALRKIGILSGGVPATINRLAANAMLEAFSDDATRIFAEHVERAAQTQSVPTVAAPPAASAACVGGSHTSQEPGAASAAHGDDQAVDRPAVPIQAIPAQIAALRNSSATIAAVRSRLISVDTAPAHEYRRSPRVRPAKATAILQTQAAAGGRWLEYGFPTSLSREGAGVLVERPLEKNTVCRLWILDGVGRPVCRRARVARARPLGLSGGLYEVGFEFDEPLPEVAVVAPTPAQERIVA